MRIGMAPAVFAALAGFAFGAPVHGRSPGTPGATSAPAPGRGTTTVPGVPNGVWNVLANGVVGDGATDDRAALQALIDRAPEGSTIHFPRGVYELASFNPSPAGARHGNVLQISKSHLTFECDTGAVIRLRAGAFAGKPYNVFSNYDAVDPNHFGTYRDVTFRGCTFDEQGASNPWLTKQVRVVLQLGDTSDVTVEDCRFVHMNGSNTVVVGRGGRAASRARIVGNRFFDPTDGDRTNSDHSTIYLVASNSIVAQNFFTNATETGRTTATACELHGSDQRFVGNIVSGYRQMTFDVSVPGETAQPAVSQVVAGNLADDMNNFGSTIWVEPGATLSNLVIERNIVRLNPVTRGRPYDDFAAFVTSTAAGGTLVDAVIRDNETSTTEGIWNRRRGIDIAGNTSGLQARGNLVRGFTLGAFAGSRGKRAVALSRVDVSDNTFTDCGVGDVVLGIGGEAPGSTLDGLRVERNIFFNSVPQARPIYIATMRSGSHYRIAGNRAMNFVPPSALVTLAGTATPVDVEMDSTRTYSESAVPPVGGAGRVVVAARRQTGMIAPRAHEDVTVQWSKPFADSAYTPTCSVSSEGTAGPGLTVERIRAVTRASVVVQVANRGTSRSDGLLNCIALHD